MELLDARLAAVKDYERARPARTRRGVGTRHIDALVAVRHVTDAKRAGGLERGSAIMTVPF